MAYLSVTGAMLDDYQPEEVGYLNRNPFLRKERSSSSINSLSKFRLSLFARAIHNRIEEKKIVRKIQKRRRSILPF